MDAPDQVAWDVRGKTALVTGGNCGIGRATSLELARLGASVVFTARDMQKGRKAEAALRAELAFEPDPSIVPGEVNCMQLDLADFASIQAFAQSFLERYPKLHVLVHNAGLVLSERRETVDGFEATFGINHLGPYFLNRLLEERLRACAPARIVVVSSDAHKRARHGLDFEDLQSKRSYDGIDAYAKSKLANALFTRSLARRLAGSGVTANCLHPGVVATDFTADGDARGLWRFVFRWLRIFLLSPENGARTSVHLATAPELADTSGQYFARSLPARSSAAARDDDAADRLWEISEALCGGAALTPF